MLLITAALGALLGSLLILDPIGLRDDDDDDAVPESEEGERLPVDDSLLVGNGMATEMRAAPDVSGPPDDGSPPDARMPVDDSQLVRNGMASEMRMSAEDAAPQTNGAPEGRMPVDDSELVRRGAQTAFWPDDDLLPGREDEADAAEPGNAERVTDVRADEATVRAAETPIPRKADNPAAPASAT